MSVCAMARIDLGVAALRGRIVLVVGMVGFLLLLGAVVGTPGSAGRRLRRTGGQQGGLREQQARVRPTGWSRLTDDSIAGFTTDISATPGSTVTFKVKTDARQLPRRHLPARLLRRGRRAPGRDRVARTHRRPSPTASPTPPGSSTAGTGRPRSPGRSPPTPYPGSTTRSCTATTPAARTRCRSSSATTPARRRCCSRRRTRPGRPTTATAATACTTATAPGPGGLGLQGVLQPADRGGRRGELHLQRRVPDAPVPGGQRVRRELHDERRHRPARTI